MLKKRYLIVLILIAAFCKANAQNISGEKIIVGPESITVINFPDKVLNINFSDDEAYNYYIPTRREEKSIAIQFNKEQKTAPNTNLLVNEGGRSHMFRLIFDSTYDINDDSRPPLWYDHSDLKGLKAFVQKQKKVNDAASNETALAELKKEQEAQELKEREERKAQAVAAQKKQEEEAAAKAQEIEKRRIAEEKAQKEHAATLAKAKKDAEDKDKQAKLAAQKEEQANKLAEEKVRKDAEVLAKKQAEEEKHLADIKAAQQAEARVKDKQLKEAQAKQDAEATSKAKAEKEQKEREAVVALAKAEREVAEKKRIEEEKMASLKAAEERRKKVAAEDAAKKEAERIEAQERLERLVAERERMEENKKYSEVGLWQRYGRKGIDVYNFPREQVPTVISDFYIEKDTLRNFQFADSMINADISGKLNIESQQPINKGVNITLENMLFKDIQTFYKLKVENNTDEDFLLGRTYMYWYDGKNKAKQIIKSTYITYISFFPIVRPKSTQYVVFSTRSPNVVDDESLVLFVDERRKEKGSASIVIPGELYNRELAKVQAAAKRQAGGAIEEKKVEQPVKSKSKKNRKG